MSADMPAPDLEAIRTRADAATREPWEAVIREGLGGPIGDVLMPLGAGDHYRTGLTRSYLVGTQDAADAEFIAHARTDIPLLLAEVARLTADRDRLAAQISAALALVDEADAVGWISFYGPDQPDFPGVVSVNHIRRALGAEPSTQDGGEMERLYPHRISRDPDDSLPAPAPADHPHSDPSDGRSECAACGKWVWPVTHSCKGVPATDSARRRFASAPAGPDTTP